MKFWVYAIDWRSMAIEILGEYATDKMAHAAKVQYMEELPPTMLDELVKYKTLDFTPASPEMCESVLQFKRFNGRVA
jgi:hypothetical protein